MRSLSSRPPARIVSLCASNTELLSALQSLHLLVGCDRYSDYPAQKLRGIPRVGGDLDVDWERVRALKPDLVLASLSVPGMERVVEELDHQGIPYIVLDPEGFSGILEDLMVLGRIVGKEQLARELRERALRFVEKLAKRSEAFPKVPAVVEWWPKPVIVPGKRSWVNEVLSWVNLENPFQYEDKRSLAVTLEDLLRYQPRYYAVSWCGVPRRNYRISLVKERFTPFSFSPTIFPLWEGWIGRPSLRVLRGALQLYHVRRTVEEREPS